MASVHDVQNLQARLAGLLQRLAHQATLTPPTLMSICKAVMPAARAGNLEVHVAVVIFGAGDVREHGGIYRPRPPDPWRCPRRPSAAARPHPSAPANRRKRWPSKRSRSIPECRKPGAWRRGNRLPAGSRLTRRARPARRGRFRGVRARAGISLRPRKTAGSCSAA